MLIEGKQKKQSRFEILRDFLVKVVTRSIKDTQWNILEREFSCAN